jgi:hypothetical protein
MRNFEVAEDGSDEKKAVKALIEDILSLVGARDIDGRELCAACSSIIVTMYHATGMTRDELTDYIEALWHVRYGGAGDGLSS